MSERAYQAMLLLSPEIADNVWDWYNGILPQLNAPIASLLGIRYFVYPVGTNPNDSTSAGTPPFTRLANTEGLGLWRAEGTPGYAYLSDNITVAADEQGALAWMRGATWAAVRTYPALVEGPAPGEAAIRHDPAGSSPGGTSVDQYESGHVRIAVDATRESLLVVAESWYPGWHATLDGQPAADLRANWLSQGVVVPPGHHVVEFTYLPATFVWGAWVSGGAGLITLWLAAILAGTALQRRRARRAAEARSLPIGVGL